MGDTMARQSIVERDLKNIVPFLRVIFGGVLGLVVFLIIIVVGIVLSFYLMGSTDPMSQMLRAFIALLGVGYSMKIGNFTGQKKLGDFSC